MDENTSIVAVKQLQKALLADDEVQHVEGDDDATDRDKVEAGLEERFDSGAALEVQAAILVCLLLHGQLGVWFPDAADLDLWAGELTVGVGMG